MWILGQGLIAVADPGEGPGPASLPPLFSDQTDGCPLPPLSEGLDLALNSI